MEAPDWMAIKPAVIKVYEDVFGDQWPCEYYACQFETIILYGSLDRTSRVAQSALRLEFKKIEKQAANLLSLLQGLDTEGANFLVDHKEPFHPAIPALNTHPPNYAAAIDGLFWLHNAAGAGRTQNLGRSDRGRDRNVRNDRAAALAKSHFEKITGRAAAATESAATPNFLDFLGRLQSALQLGVKPERATRWLSASRRRAADE